MAKTVYNDHVREMHGAYTKDGTIHRRKTFRDSDGRIKGMGVNESYKITNPRDWKKKPATGKELEHQLRFKQACAETKRILLAAKPKPMPLPMQPLIRTLHPTLHPQLPRPKTSPRSITGRTASTRN